MLLPRAFSQHTLTARFCAGNEEDPEDEARDSDNDFIDDNPVMEQSSFRDVLLADRQTYRQVGT